SDRAVRTAGTRGGPRHRPHPLGAEASRGRPRAPQGRRADPAGLPEALGHGAEVLAEQEHAMSPSVPTPRFDPDAVLAGLKPFQRATVEHAFRRLWTDDDSVSRFLVADEVGLGKTLIAKGVAARAIAHLRETTDRTVTIVYICSNSQIAGQNLDRLRELTGGEAQRNADRI